MDKSEVICCVFCELVPSISSSCFMDETPFTKITWQSIKRCDKTDQSDEKELIK